MSFQKLTALVALVVFASQGVMAAPYPHPPPQPAAGSPTDVADSLLDTAGKAAGVGAAVMLPNGMVKQGIKTAGGIPPAYPYPYPYPYPLPPSAVSPEGVTDNLTDNAGKLIAGVGTATLPSEVVDSAIEGANGTVAREEDVEF